MQSSLPYGSSNSVTGLAIDAARGTVFSANEFAGTITTFSESTGAVEQSQPIASFAAGSFPAGLLLDSAHEQLFVSISTRFSTPGAGGWVLVLNATTLATEANLSFAAPPTTPFEPTFLAEDLGTDQLFVENATGGEVAVVSLTTGAVTKYLQCPVSLCAEHPYGLVNVPEYHTPRRADLRESALARQYVQRQHARAALRTLERSADGVGGVRQRGPDPLGRELLVLRLDGDVPRLQPFHPRSPRRCPRAPPPASPGCPTFPSRTSSSTTNIDGSEEIATYNASTALIVAASGKSDDDHPSVPRPRGRSATGTAVAGGPGNGSTTAYALPTLALERAYVSFPLAQSSVAADPTDGSFAVASLGPDDPARD